METYYYYGLDADVADYRYYEDQAKEYRTDGVLPRHTPRRASSQLTEAWMRMLQISGTTRTRRTSTATARARCCRCGSSATTR